MAKNVLSLQLLRNTSVIYTNKADAVAGIKSSGTQDGVIKLARYTESGATKTIFGIYNDAATGTPGMVAGYTIYESYKEAIDALQAQVDSLESGSSEAIDAIMDILGDGVSSGAGETVSEQLAALSGSTADTSGSTSVEGAKKYTDGKIDALDVTDDAAVAGQYVAAIEETDGIVAVKTRANVSEAVLNNYAKGSDSGAVASTDTVNQAISKLENQIDNVSSAVEGLDYSGITTSDSAVVTNVTETDGVISATAANVGGLKLTGYEQGTASGDVAATDTINQAFGKVENQIAAINDVVADLDGTITADTGYYINKVDEVNGKISGTTAALPTVAAIGEAGKPITAVSQSLGTISATTGTVNAEYVNVADSGNLFTGTTVEAVLAEIDAAYKAADTAIIGGASESANTLGELETLINNISADAATYTIRKDTADLPATVKERYTLVETKNGTSTDKQVSIDIPKDSHIVSINYISTSGDPHYQNLEYVYVTDSGTTSTTYVDMSALVLEAEFASGVTVGDGHVVHGVVDSTSETFLTVGANGFKLAGVQDAIDSAVSGATDKIEELSGKTVTELESSNSSITVSSTATADGTVKYDVITDASKIKMSGFTSTDVLSGITSSSSITEAFKEVDAVITANEQVTAQALNDLKASKLENIVVNGVSGTVASNTATVTIDGANVALTGYQKPASGTAIVASDDVNTAIGKLEAKLDDATAGGLNGVDAGSGITVSTLASNRQTITAKLADPANVTGIDENAIKFNATDQGLYIDTLDCGTY